MPPSIRGLWLAPDGTSEEDDNRDVLIALETLQSLRERLRCLQHEELSVRALACGLGLIDWANADSTRDEIAIQSGPAAAAASLALVPRGAPLERIPQDRPQQPPDLRAAGERMAGALSRAATAAATAAANGAGGGGGVSGTGAVLASHQGTLLRWANEQIFGAQDSIEATKTVLGALRQEAAIMRVRARAAMSVRVRVDRIDWALSKGSTTIVRGELSGILYQSVRDPDHTGTTKIQIRAAAFFDPQVRAAASTSTPGPGGVTSAGSNVTSANGDEAPAGEVLALWNPDESWAEDEMVRLYAVHGALEQRWVVYDHIEVLVHPIRVRLTYALAQVSIGVAEG